MLRVLFAGLLIALAVGCSGDDKKAVPPTEPTATASTWDASAVWAWNAPAISATWQSACGKPLPAIQQTDACVLTVMQQTGASQKAIGFYKTNGFFLESFQELGKVDYGRGSAIWQNMGRSTQQLFLNGTPPVIEASERVLKDWKQSPANASFISQSPIAVPWGEYGELKTATATGGGQQMRFEFPLRDCRACPNLAYLVVDYGFDASGSLTSVSFQPPRVP